MAPGLKYCVCCGKGSHRTDWINATPDGSYVACDGHTKEEFAMQVKLAQSTGTPVGEKPVAPKPAVVPPPPPAAPAIPPMKSNIEPPK